MSNNNAAGQGRPQEIAAEGRALRNPWLVPVLIGVSLMTYIGFIVLTGSRG